MKIESLEKTIEDSRSSARTNRLCLIGLAVVVIGAIVDVRDRLKKRKETLER